MSSFLTGKFGTVLFFALLVIVGASTVGLAPEWEQDVEISLKAEPIFHIGHVTVTNTILASTLVVLFFIGFSIVLSRKRGDLSSRLYNLVEMIIEGLLDLVQATVGKGVGRKIFPIIATFLLFILANNWFGITPIVGSVGIWEKHHIEATEKAPSDSTDAEKSKGSDEGHGSAPMENIAPLEKEGPTKGAEVEATREGKAMAEKDAKHAEESGEEIIFVPLLRSANSDLNMTLAIALISVAFIQIVAVRTIGFRSYIRKFLNFSSPIMFAVGLLEVISEIVKIFSFAFRLFGNIFAGDVLLIVISSLLPFAGPIPFIAIELFAGMVQALVFAMLSMVFLKSHLSHAEGH